MEKHEAIMLELTMRQTLAPLLFIVVLKVLVGGKRQENDIKDAISTKTQTIPTYE